ncbi:hypothetical protein F3Y22_tig00110890pilonHSYRG00681 [Hibiscus syriacus]|uniref:Uncharacterized protein n=1 Tax=Hibiscus syriacus TaxID=106335 RepID=A0A6A2ZH28_HIBSY|nr:hypothetical protein F3Y22_tig00110890pilonHSYRG00681 [Hibiscus syriacus]
MVHVRPGNNIFHNWSEPLTVNNSPSANLVSVSVLSSPPKNGCIAINPINPTFLNSYSHAFTATRFATLPPALFPAMKHYFKFAFGGRFRFPELVVAGYGIRLHISEASTVKVDDDRYVGVSIHRRNKQAEVEVSSGVDDGVSRFDDVAGCFRERRALRSNKFRMQRLMVPSERREKLMPKPSTDR